MRITLVKDAVSGNVEIPAGDYWVSLAESGTINLAGKGKDWKLPATRRRSTTKTKRLTVSFYCGGGTNWSLVVSTPKQGEWVAIIEVGKNDRRK